MVREFGRPSTIRDLSEKVKKKKYGKYLLELTIKNLRIFKDVSVHFDFPITALIGPNGGGKSTVLMAAGCAYRDVKPSDFFPKSSIDNISMAKIEYQLLDRSVRKDGEIRRSISFKETKWSRKKVLRREVKYFGVRRTVPPAERKDLYKLRSSRITPTDEIGLDAEQIRTINWILGIKRNYKVSQFTNIRKDLFVGTKDRIQYSEFHFGAGESSIARLVYELERLQENALVLIEEIENGLHPIALNRFIDYLFDVAKRKKLQIIFTTHSPYAIEPLPPEAIWCCYDGNAVQGKMDIESVRVILGSVEKKIIVFVEDDFAKDLFLTILRYSDNFDLIGAIEIHSVGGEGNVQKFTKGFNENPANAGKRAIGVLDGDVEVESTANDHLVKLPGDKTPELEVWEKVRENLDEVIAKLTIKLLSLEKQSLVKDAIEEVNIETREPHLLYSKLGEKLGYLSEIKVRNAFLEVYVELLEKSEYKPVVEKIRAAFDEVYN